MVRSAATPTPYAILGVSPLDAFSTIRAAWLRLVKAHHPDLHPGQEAQATAQLCDINDAYDTISVLHNRVADGARRMQQHAPRHSQGQPKHARSVPQVAAPVAVTVPAPALVTTAQPQSDVATRFANARSVFDVDQSRIKTVAFA